MARTFEQILTGLAALRAEEFDAGDGIQKLGELTDDLMASPEPERGIRAMFDVMERMSAADLGTPGPLVHALERMRGRYEDELVESIKRQPTSLNVWMVNRILNGTRDISQRQFYINLLRFVVEHPAAPASAKQDAQRFIAHQTKGA